MKLMRRTNALCSSKLALREPLAILWNLDAGRPGLVNTCLDPISNHLPTASTCLHPTQPSASAEPLQPSTSFPPSARPLNSLHHPESPPSPSNLHITHPPSCLSRLTRRALARPCHRPPCTPSLCRALTTSAAATAAAATTAVSYKYASQDDLVSGLVAQGLVAAGGAVEAAMRAMDRREFADTHIGIPNYITYADAQFPLGQGQTLPAPSLHAECLGLLAGHAGRGAAVLDVGAGSCYLAACLALMVGPAGRVVALERQARLLEQAGWVLARALPSHLAPHTPPPSGHGQEEGEGEGSPREQRQQPGSTGHVLGRICNVTLMHGNALEEGVLAGPAAGPYDAIHVGAAVRQLGALEGLLAALRPGGRMVVPLGPPGGMQALTVVDKGPDGRLATTHVRDVKLPPLTPPGAGRPL